jgi:hypothetical protein
LRGDDRSDTGFVEQLRCERADVAEDLCLALCGLCGCCLDPTCSSTPSSGEDLLVVGSRGNGGFTEPLLGSVSRYCAHHDRCPVVIVRARAAAPTFG